MTIYFTILLTETVHFRLIEPGTEVDLSSFGTEVFAVIPKSAGLDTDLLTKRRIGLACGLFSGKYAAETASSLRGRLHI